MVHKSVRALNMLVIHQAADEIAHKEDRNNGIANLIKAGEKLAAEVGRRFYAVVAALEHIRRDGI